MAIIPRTKGAVEALHIVEAEGQRDVVHRQARIARVAQAGMGGFGGGWRCGVVLLALSDVTVAQAAVFKPA
jgi:hypothetical protein